MAKQTKGSGEFKKGDKVEFSVGNGWVPATVVELIKGSTGTKGKVYPDKVRMKTLGTGAEVTRTINSVVRAA